MIIPSFNQGPYIRETLESCLSQEYRPLEVLVFDGASTDETVEVLRSFGDVPELRWVSEPDRGVVDAVNKGLASARGAILAIQSSDDYYLPGALEAAVAALEESPDLAFVYGDVEYIDADGDVAGRTDLGPWSLRAFLGRDMYVNQAGTFFRDWAAREVGPWDEDVPYAADSDYWLRMGLRFPARNVGRLISRYRYHDAQRDKAGTRPARDWERAVRKRIAAGEVAPELLGPARRGIHLTWHHYTPESKWKERTASLYRALIAEPQAVLKRGFPRRELLPGREPIWKFLSRTKRRIGSLFFDRPRLAWPLLRPGGAGPRWPVFWNRNETVVPGPERRGFDCAWQWTSELTLARTFPSAGRRLLRSALSEWPIVLSGGESPSPGQTPVVSFVIGHRGVERIPLLLATIRSLQAQCGCPVEIVVVEQAATSVLLGKLAGDVRWILQEPPVSSMPYSRAWAFNAGAREAKGRILVLHDNDILAPAGYAAELLRISEEGFEAMRLTRYLFDVNEATTERVSCGSAASSSLPRSTTPIAVRQNLQGGTIAIRRECYFRIGGHDEGFLGWGGEDNEFYDRCRLLRFYPWGYLPFVHLWHAPQPEKTRRARPLRYFGRVMNIPREERARRLAAKPIGSPDGVQEPLEA